MNLATIFFLSVFHKSIHSYPTEKVSLPISLHVCLNQVLSSFTFFNLDENKISTEPFVDPDLNELLMCRGSKDVATYNMERFITKRSNIECCNSPRSASVETWKGTSRQICSSLL